MTIQLPRLRDQMADAGKDTRSAADRILGDEGLRRTVGSWRKAAIAAIEDLPDNLPEVSIDSLPGRQRQSPVRRNAPLIAMVGVGVLAGLTIGWWMATATPLGSAVRGAANGARSKVDEAMNRRNGGSGSLDGPHHRFDDPSGAWFGAYTPDTASPISPREASPAARSMPETTPTHTMARATTVESPSEADRTAG
jgi:hypothetical protein